MFAAFLSTICVRKPCLSSPFVNKLPSFITWAEASLGAGDVLPKVTKVTNPPGSHHHHCLVVSPPAPSHSLATADMETDEPKHTWEVQLEAAMELLRMEGADQDAFMAALNNFEDDRSHIM